MGLNLAKANLIEAQLGEADLSYARVVAGPIFLVGGLVYARAEADVAEGPAEMSNLSGADLTGADLNSADLSGAQLTEANLTGANLIGAKLIQADLTRADLTRATRLDCRSYRAPSCAACTAINARP